MKGKIKTVIGNIFLSLGTLGWCVGLCAGTPATVDGSAGTNDWLLFAFVIAILIVGSIFIALSIKINPEPFYKVLHEEKQEVTYEIVEEHNYSDDFEQIYNQLLLQRVDRIIDDIQKPTSI